MKKTILQFGAAAMILLAGFNANAQSPAGSSAWKINGNSGTNATVNFLGTIDKIPLAFRTSNIERMRITRGGNVGIGSPNPAARLNVDSGSAVTLSSGGYVVIGNTTGDNLAMDYYNIQARYNGSYSNLYLNNNGGETFAGNTTLSSSGLIGYGVYEGLFGFSPSTGIGVYGESNTNFGVFGYTGGSSSGSDPNFAAGVHGYNASNGNGVTGVCENGSGTVGWSTNYVGIYGYTGNSGSYAGLFNGDVYTTGSYLPSDQKLKQNIKDASNAMDIVNQLHPKIYQYRQDGNYKLMNFPKGDRYGLISEDVEKVLPNLVKETKYDVTKSVETEMRDPKDPSKQIKVSNLQKTGETIDFKAVNYTELIPILIKGMQEQQQTIETQQQQINDLKQMVQTLANSKNSSSLKSTVADASIASLQQNLPNPFSSNTVIRCTVPSSAKQAQLQVYSSNGNLLKTYSLKNGANEVTVNGGTFSSGQYLYSLLVDGNKVDSKSMVLTK
jgi:hypothetical protein